MKGLDLAREYFEEYGKPMLKDNFSQYMDRIAVGLAGHGSECFGFDDDISTDHDYEPGFCIWITKEDDKLFGFNLFRAYSKLPKSYKGISLKSESAFGASYKGVMLIEDFYRNYTGSANIPETNTHWLNIPSYMLAECTNGEVFYDGLGEFTRIRNELKKGYPEDVRRKKLASCLFYMAQAGQYNYERCIFHKEEDAAILALNEFVKNTLSALYLINNEYEPYYKWVFKGTKKIKELTQIPSLLSKLLQNPTKYEENKVLIQSIADIYIEHMKNKNITQGKSNYLEEHAYSLNETIKDNILRTTPVML